MKQKESILTEWQVKKPEPRTFTEDGVDFVIYPQIRYDDECGNGHNTFAITATIRTTRGVTCGGGCCHEEFAKAYPEYAHLIKWHLCSSDGPMHYLANTLYLASDSADSRYKVGEPCRWSRVLVFEGSFTTHKFDKEFIEFLSHNAGVNFEVVEVPHENEPDGYQYNPRYTFKGFECEWYKCPFDTKEKAEEYMLELRHKKWHIETIVTEYQKAKPRELEAARHSAIWPEATDEQLSLPKEELEKLLKKRLPKLMREFRKDIEALGFTY